MATIYIDGVKSKLMAIGTTEIANILKGTSDPSSSIGSDGQLYLKYGSYEKHYFMDNKIVVVENKNDSTDLKLYIVGLTKSSSGIAITDTDLLAYLSDITSGYLKDCCTYDTADSTAQTGLLAIGDWGSGMTLHTYIPGWTQYKAGTFYGVIDLTESPVPASGYPTYQENPFVDPDTIVESGILNSFAKVNGQWQNLIGTDIDAIQSGGSPQPQIASIVIENAKVSDKTEETYMYPTYSDISDYDCVAIKIHTTVNDVYYENYICADCDRLPLQFSKLILYDANGNTWNRSFNITIGSTSITQVAYTGNYEDVYIDIIGINRNVGTQ